jgi:hypothetical protein
VRPPNVIEKVLTAERELQAQKGKKRFIELLALAPFTYRENDMRHAVDLDHNLLQASLIC